MFNYACGILKSYYFDVFPPRLNWAITDLCNSRCTFCEAPDGFKGKNDCSLERVLSLCKEIADLKVSQVHLVGGEVFLRKHIWEILEELNKYGIKVTITTNGLVFHTFDQAKMELIGKYIRRLRFSLDSTLKDQYDSIRGVKGAYGQVTEAIKKCANLKNTELIVTSVIMQQNIDQIPKIIEWSKQNKISFVDFQPVSPVSIFSDLSSLNSKMSLAPGKNHMKELASNIEIGIKLAKKNKIKTSLPFFKYYAQEYFLSLEDKGDSFYFYDIVKRFNCIKISLSAFLDYNGTLKICPLLKNGVDIKEKSLKQGWEELKKNREMIRKMSFPVDCKYCFCNIAENMLFSVIRHPVANIKLLSKLLSGG